MAERDYVRLGCTVEACSGDHKAHGLCLRHYRQSRRGGVKVDCTACVVCSSPITAVMAGKLYCSKACKQKAWERAHPEVNCKPARLCAYWTGYCIDCERGLGGRVKQLRCEHCKAQRGREAWRAAAEAVHRAAGRELRCDGCLTCFCPLYGSGNVRLCDPCSVDRGRAARRVDKAARRARVRSGTVDRVDPFAVFERDGWSCRLCGIATPKDKRGTYEPDAPELDHIKPLSKGGEHSYANTQCACRRCNGVKSDRFEVAQA